MINGIVLDETATKERAAMNRISRSKQSTVQKTKRSRKQESLFWISLSKQDKDKDM